MMLRLLSPLKSRLFDCQIPIFLAKSQFSWLNHVNSINVPNVHSLNMLQIMKIPHFSQLNHIVLPWFPMCFRENHENPQLFPWFPMVFPRFPQLPVPSAARATVLPSMPTAPPKRSKASASLATSWAWPDYENGNYLVGL